jgi:hypothetical protein
MARQRLRHITLEDIGAGLVDHQIMDKRGINARTFYRYKKLIYKQCQKILDKQSEQDISPWLYFNWSKDTLNTC